MRGAWALVCASALACGESSPPGSGAGGLGGGTAEGGSAGAGGDAGAPATKSCPVLIFGGSASGVSAAWASASLGAKTCLVEAGSRLGGQLLVVPELDENPPCEPDPANGCVPWDEPYSDSYRAMRRALQDYARDTHGLTDSAASPTCGGLDSYFDPGQCSCCTLCYETDGAQAFLQGLLAEAADTLEVLTDSRLLELHLEGDRVSGATVLGPDGEVRLESQVVVDATEMGDVIGAGDLPHRSGAEAQSDTGEPHAREVADPECVQPMSFPLFMELRPETEDHRITEPPGYDASRYSLQPWSPSGWIGSAVAVSGASATTCGDPTAMDLWNWRRMRASVPFSDAVTEISQINWHGGNNFNRHCLGDEPSGCNPLGKSEADVQAILARAREHALGFAYWLQTDVVRHDGLGTGYPNWRLAPEISGTTDGVASAPYVRESRRIRAMVTVVEQDISAQALRATCFAPRACTFSDSVAIGQYAMDVHMCAAGDPWSYEQVQAPQTIDRTLPYQLPLRATIPETTNGFLASGKNVGTTHITNGAYRLHPIEWHTGLASGALAATAALASMEPRDIADDTAAVRRLQDVLVQNFGSPIYWYLDVAHESAALFRATQMVAVEGVMTGVPASLRFQPELLLTRSAAVIVLHRLLGLAPAPECADPPAFSDVPCTDPLYAYAQALAEARVIPGPELHPADNCTRRDFVAYLVAGLGWRPLAPAVPSFEDVPADDPSWGAIEAARSGGLLDEVAPDTLFEPGAAMTRGSAALVAFNEMRLRYGLP